VQYYNLIHLGFQGYREVMENCLANARLLSKSLEATGWYHCLSDIHRQAPTSDRPAAVKERVKTAVASAADTMRPAESVRETSERYIAGLPVVSFRFTDEFRKQYPHIQQQTVSLLLRARQWIIPNYALPPGENDTEILRVVVRESMGFDLLDRLITDIVNVTETLMNNDEVDLSILQKTRRRGPGGKHVKEGREGDPETGGKEKKAGGDSTHRTVC